ncbi:hypothetical protein LY90DRAFT_628881 [Neocallimastix californiae]|uniref:Scaffoldin n=1 Tax=Neocallimastix californiae TaxID=1754190 RepID=A0A1Y2AVZ1_9FUNG|nr:hypothetical protein LY90DRAFT_628881 [Neocallimastix californiae]|eukprot:ORY26729.1 hypothetical protein LY90DRAFT_628881 [Neocallimastix californiae]
MGIRIFLKTIILLIASISNLVHAGTDCSESNSGKYLFKCTNASSCSEITEVGYYLNQKESNEPSNELFKCKSEGNCSLITESPVESNETTFYLDGASSTTDKKYNKLIKCKGKNVQLQSRGASSNGGSNNNEFNCEKIDNSASNTSIDHYISMEDDKDNLITCTVQGCYLEDNISGYFINTNSGGSEGRIIVCEKDEGYCDIAEDDNICYGAGDVIVKTEKDGSKKAYLCTSDSEDEKDIIEIQSNTENIKYISITMNNPDDDEDDEDNFLGVSDGSKICIKIGEGSVIPVDDKYCPKECDVTTGTNCVENSYYLVHKKTLNIITNGYGFLYFCKTEKDCTQITETGYYIIDKDTVYFCSNTSCRKDNTVDECDNNGLGRIVYKDNKLSICLNGVTAVDIVKSNNGNYMVTGSGTDSNSDNGSGNSEEDILFASKGKFAIITIKDQIITLNSKYNNNMKYVYVNSSGNQKVMEKGNTCPKNGSLISDVLEFECNRGICTEVN